ncbi:hypothetical protein [Streptacidiphilus sp. EB103A]|jgi:hypothetical protein|uniref:hypothetical protein n=1 Tax=Streptacidiphilus sp. EB103A TaxID=3156275 RepID=UPI003517939A
MSSMHSDSRIRLGQILDPTIPLGPFGDLLLTFHESASGTGRTHGDPQCRMLRSGRAVTSREGQLKLAVGNLCGHCAWTVPQGHPVVDFIGAVTAVTGLRTWTGSPPGPDPEVVGDSEAQAVLNVDESPDGQLGAQVSSAQLREVRERCCRHWRRLHTCMLASYAATTAYPCLGVWAQPLHAELAEVIEYRRRELAALLPVADLVQGACAAALPEPALQAGPVFAFLGGEALRVLQRAWCQWQGAVGSSWGALEESRSAASTVVFEAFGRRRMGRTEALQALDVLVADWSARARAQAAECERAPGWLVTVQIPPVTRDSLTGAEQDPLSCWDAGILATHQVSAQWPQGSVELMLPEPVAEHLLGCAEPAGSTERPAMPGTAAAGRGAPRGIGSDQGPVRQLRELHAGPVLG